MKQTYICIVYVKHPARQFSGILGEIDLYKVQILLVGGKQLIEEDYSGSDPIKWYKDVLEEQDIFIRQGKQQKWKGQHILWMEVDIEKTPIHEFTSSKDLQDGDTETLAWKAFLYPCHSGTTKECLGFAVSARETALQAIKQPIYLDTVLQAIL